jgi:hypothetical protein
MLIIILFPLSQTLAQFGKGKSGSPDSTEFASMVAK